MCSYILIKVAKSMQLHRQLLNYSTLPWHRFYCGLTDPKKVSGVHTAPKLYYRDRVIAIMCDNAKRN